MNTGDIVLCIKNCPMKNGPNKGKIAISKGKVYKIVEIGLINSSFSIIDNFNNNHKFTDDKEYFVSLKEYRKLKLNKLNEIKI